MRHQLSEQPIRHESWRTLVKIYLTPSLHSKVRYLEMLSGRLVPAMLERFDQLISSSSLRLELLRSSFFDVNESISKGRTDLLRPRRHGNRPCATATAELPHGLTQRVNLRVEISLLSTRTRRATFHPEEFFVDIP